MISLRFIDPTMNRIPVTFNQVVVGSIPTGLTKDFNCLVAFSVSELYKFCKRLYKRGARIVLARIALPFQDR